MKNISLLNKLVKKRFYQMFVWFLIGLIIATIGVGVLIYHLNHKENIPNISNYEIYRKNYLNHPSYYPSNQTVSTNLYQPIAQWTGRLILPSKDRRQTDKSVLFEVHNAEAKHQDLVGKTVKLKWSKNSNVQEYVRAVTQDVNFTRETRESQKAGQLHPERLNGFSKVDPLESLAGARPEDDALVMIKNPTVAFAEGKEASLIIEREPVQITGRFYALVKLVKRESEKGDIFTIRHFNPIAKEFNGVLEKIHIPQVPADRNGIERSTNHQIEKSPLNSEGWYIYGAKGADGIFVVQALEPRAVIGLQPDEIVLGQKAGIAYIDRQIWKKTEAQKGTAKTILIDPNTRDKNTALSQWREGDTAIVMHIFGGIGGKKAESEPLGVVTGHFAYGTARVVRDRFTNELRFDIEYRQIYAHNPDGIVAGAIKWFSYMGDLQRGWLGNRPVSDIIIKLDAVTRDYNFDGIKLSPMAEFTRQLDIMAARYRVGDGTGAAIVTPVTSCVQDANQALYVTIKRVETEIASNPRIRDWLKRNQKDPQTLRFQQLVKLGRSLEKNLVPLGIVRSDWYNNVERLAGTNSSNGFINTFSKGITSWRTVLPRRAHDEIATILLKNGASLWVIRTNQVGGWNPNITPRAPTALFGHRTN